MLDSHQLPAVDGSNLTGINTDLVSDTTPQLGGNLDTNGNDIEVGASDRITLGGIASGSYPEFQIKSTGSINQLLAYDGQIDFGRVVRRNVQTKVKSTQWCRWYKY